MEFKFNIRGHLFPYEIIETDLDEFEREFVDNFDENSTRYEIFERYLNYVNALKEVFEEDFIQWIDGSFVTTKINPNDIDLVSIIPFEIYEANLERIVNELIAHNARMIYGVDAYIVPNYPQDHKRHIITQADLIYWKDLFGNTRATNRSKQRFPKGIIQLNITTNE